MRQIAGPGIGAFHHLIIRVNPLPLAFGALSRSSLKFVAIHEIIDMANPHDERQQFSLCHQLLQMLGKVLRDAGVHLHPRVHAFVGLCLALQCAAHASLRGNASVHLQNLLSQGVCFIGGCTVVDVSVHGFLQIRQSACAVWS